MTDEVSFNLGSHSARIEAVEKRIIELQVSQKEQTGMLQMLLLRDAGFKGNWSAIVSMSIVVSTIVGFLIAWFKK